MAPQTTTAHICKLTPSTPAAPLAVAVAVDIEDLHRQAVHRGDTTYVDPSTGFMAFTELAHLKRGVCCGRQCRHCPYGWVNVPDKNCRREPKVQSGDKDAVKRLANKLVLQHSDDDDDLQHGRKATIISGQGGRHGGTLTRKNVPYTRKGDAGTSQLLTGERRFKDDVAFEAMGTIDELCSVVGVAHAELMSSGVDKYENLEQYLLDIMSRLFDIGSHVAKPRKVHDDDDSDDEGDRFHPDGVGGGFHESHIEDLEEWIDMYTEELPELLSFILPTGSKLAAQLHVARTVCRRAERRCIALVEQKVCDPHALKYLNRLSDFFFSAARYANYKEGQPDLLYRLPHRGAKQRNRILSAKPQQGEL
jgi:cob(I)alamin adenosyltransferase